MAGRVFLRGIEGEKYEIRQQRQERLGAEHVIRQDARFWKDEKAVGHEDSSPESRGKWMVGPGDNPFLTQTLQSHFVRLEPGGTNGGHGHQNEAAFWILEGHGYEIHDGQRYEWSAGDLVVVHNDSRHQHFNASSTEPALALVFKAKGLWMYLGMTQQGKRGSIPDGAEDDYREFEDWSRLWTPGVERLQKIVHSADRPWVEAPGGRIKRLTGEDVRMHSVDIWLQELDGAATPPRHWHMADELFYVLEGSGELLEWPVEAQIEDRYRARVARTPRRSSWTAGDMVYIPQNTVHELRAPEGARLVCAQNRVFRLIGYDSVIESPPVDEPDRVAGKAAV